ncbi:hypothetical protein LTR74_018856, partial [Friedmanniomyces endolithicus]
RGKAGDEPGDREIGSDTTVKEIRTRLGITGTEEDEYQRTSFVVRNRMFGCIRVMLKGGTGSRARAVYTEHAPTLPDLSWTRISPARREQMITQILGGYPVEWWYRVDDAQLPRQISNWRLIFYHMKRKSKKNGGTEHNGLRA